MHTRALVPQGRTRAGARALQARSAQHRSLQCKSLVPRPHARARACQVGRLVLHSVLEEALLQHRCARPFLSLLLLRRRSKLSMVLKLSALRATGAGGSSGWSAGAAASVGNTNGVKRRLSQLTATPTASAPKAAAAPQRPSNAPVELFVARYGNKASDFLNDWSDNQKLWQVQLTHEATPSLAVNVVAGFNDYLSKLHADDASIPENLVELRKGFGIVLQLTKLEPNPQRAPLKNWRVAFYIAGNSDALQESIALIHGYIAHRVAYPLSSDRRAFPDAQDQVVNVRPSSDVPRLEFPDLKEPAVTVAEPSDDLPCKLLECAGPQGNKYLAAAIEVVDDEHVAIGFTGRTWALRQAFEDAEVPLVVEESQEPVRVINGAAGNVSDPEIYEKVLAIFGDQVLHRGACLVHIDGEEPGADSAVANLLATLREMPHLAMPAAA